MCDDLEMCLVCGDQPDSWQHRPCLTEECFSPAEHHDFVPKIAPASTERIFRYAARTVKVEVPA